MSKRLGNALPAGLLERLSGRDLQGVADKVIVVCTVDDRGFPHPALLSYFEVLALDERSIRLATYADSRTSANSRRDGRLTLVVIDSHVAYYIKGRVEERVHAMRATSYNAKFHVDVEEVLADEANQELEPGAYIAGGITYVNPRRSDEMQRARLVLAELRE
jgi:hypothetical protein